MKTAEDIRRALESRYPDPDDDPPNPIIAIGVVLISAVMLGTVRC